MFANKTHAPPAPPFWRVGIVRCCRHRACGVLGLLGRLPTCHPRSHPQRLLRSCCKICRRRRPNRLRPTFAGKVMAHRAKFGEPLCGWQRLAAAAGDGRARSACIFLSVMPHLARCCCRRLGHTLHVPSQFAQPPRAGRLPQLRVILLRRRRRSLPVAPRACVYRGRPDPLGDHRAACANAGVLASHALPLERAIARVCQAAGTQCASGGHEHGCAGLGRPPHRSCRQWAPALAPFPTGHRRHHRQPSHASRRGCLVVVRSRFSTEAATRLRLLARHCASAPPAAMQSAARFTSPPHSVSSVLPGSVTSEGKRPSCTKSSMTYAGSSPSLPAG